SAPPSSATACTRSNDISSACLTALVAELERPPRPEPDQPEPEPPDAPVARAEPEQPKIEVRITITPPTDDTDVEAKLAMLPTRPGVYLLRDHTGKVIYVGKAKSLRSRVRCYFRGGDERAQVQFLVTRVATFETLV